MREDVLDVVAGVSEREPDTDGHGVLVPIEFDGHRERFPDAFGKLNGIRADVDGRAVGAGPGPR